MSEKKLIVKDLTIHFKTDAGMVQAVRNISFDLYKGETLAIVGESGSGKSVTNRAIIGILANNAVVPSGEIIYDGQDLLKISEEDLKLRGPGDFFGSAQHGLPPLKIADIACNSELMSMAQECAAELLSDDPNLDKPNHRALKMDTMRLFNKDIIG